MMKLQCPACDAEVVFKSRASVFGVCSFCSSTLIRTDLKIETIGKMSLLPQDMSPLQIGTSGVFEGSRFEVVGRQRIGWENGTWNEWYLHFDNGKDGWLADAQGFYMVSFEMRELPQIPALNTLGVSKSIELMGNRFVVEDIHEVSCAGSEGELPVKSVKGRRSTSVDLVGGAERFGNIDYSPEGNRLFLGSYIEFEALKFMNLRQLDGW